MLNYEEFKTIVTEEVEKLIGEDKELRIKEVTKNNNLKLDSLSLLATDGKTRVVTPMVHLNYLYNSYKEDGVSISEITKRIVDILMSTQPECAKGIGEIEDYASVKKHLALKVINYELNKEFLLDVPHLRKMDLALIPLFVVDDGIDTIASVTIKNTFLNKWNIDVNTLFADAFNNAPALLKPVCCSLFKAAFTRKYTEFMSLDEIRLDDNDLLILTNKSKVHGASCMFYPDVLQTIAQKLDSDLIIIPSSVHEALIMRRIDNINIEDVNNLVNYVNTSEVSVSDVLSDHVYIYNKDEHSLSMA